MNGADVLARMLPSLIVIVGALLLLRHWAQRGGRNTADAGVRVLTRAGVTKGAIVAVVAVGQRRLLVGASEHGVTLLTELPADGESCRSVATTDPVPTAGDGADDTDIPVTLDAFPWTPDRPRMAPIDRLRHLTVRQAVPSHPRRSNGAHRTR